MHHTIKYHIKMIDNIKCFRSKYKFLLVDQLKATEKTYVFGSSYLSSLVLSSDLHSLVLRSIIALHLKLQASILPKLQILIKRFEISYAILLSSYFFHKKRDWNQWTRLSLFALSNWLYSPLLLFFYKRLLASLRSVNSNQSKDRFV